MSTEILCRDIIAEHYRYAMANQVRYALGATPDDVGGPDPVEDRKMLELAEEVCEGNRSTEQHQRLAGRINVALMVTGRI